MNASDIYALATLKADFVDVTRASIVITLPMGARRMEDVPFDAARGTASYVTRSSDLRKLPSGRVTLELYANEPSERLLGRYFLDHSAFVGT